MSYTLIDKKNDIWSCNWMELPFPELKSFEKISDIFYYAKQLDFAITEEGSVVINEDHPNASENLNFVRYFLEASRSARERLFVKCPDSHKLYRLSQVLEKRAYAEIKQMIEKNSVPKGWEPDPEYMDFLKQCPSSYAGNTGYLYGFIQGKQYEQKTQNYSKGYDDGFADGKADIV